MLCLNATKTQKGLFAVLLRFEISRWNWYVSSRHQHTLLTSMARLPYVNPITGRPCWANKRSRSKNSRWMHLGAQEVGTRKVVQSIVARYSASATNSMFLSGYALTLRSTFIGQVPVAMQQAIDYLLARDGDGDVDGQ